VGGRNFPLTESQVIDLLLLLGFSYKDTKGGHSNYVIGMARGLFRKVTVDGHLAPFSQDLITLMSRQAGMTKKEFYAAALGVKPSNWPH
jgi:predicted RNA binding protein YcfA (HicA-like mRNA interferase family)